METIQLNGETITFDKDVEIKKGDNVYYSDNWNEGGKGIYILGNWSDYSGFQLIHPKTKEVITKYDVTIINTFAIVNQPQANN